MRIKEAILGGALALSSCAHRSLPSSSRPSWDHTARVSAALHVQLSELTAHKDKLDAFVSLSKGKLCHVKAWYRSSLGASENRLFSVTYLPRKQLWIGPELTVTDERSDAGFEKISCHQGACVVRSQGEWQKVHTPAYIFREVGAFCDSLR